MYTLSKRSRANCSLLVPHGIKIIERALSYGVIDFGVPDKSGRTKEEQLELYAQGRTKPGKIVTWTKNSNHIIDPKTGLSHAVDCVPWVDNRWSWTELHCAILATTMFRAAAELGHEVEWGYHLWKKDMPHFQFKP